VFHEPRELDLTFQIDTNRINSRGRLENMNKLNMWHDRRLIRVLMSDVSHEEARAGGDPRRAEKALEYPFSETMADTPAERCRLAAIEQILFPSGARTQNERNDVKIAFNAGKYGAVLVTADGDLLDRRSELGGLGIQVLTDEEAVALVEQRIAERDQRAREDSEHTHVPCPDWVGNDSLAAPRYHGMRPAIEGPSSG